MSPSTGIHMAHGKPMAIPRAAPKGHTAHHDHDARDGPAAQHDTTPETACNTQEKVRAEPPGRTMITMPAMTQQPSVTASPFARSPMMRGLAAKVSTGMSAKGSWMDCSRFRPAGQGREGEKQGCCRDRGAVWG